MKNFKEIVLDCGNLGGIKKIEAAYNFDKWIFSEIKYRKGNAYIDKDGYFILQINKITREKFDNLTYTSLVLKITDNNGEVYVLNNVEITMEFGENITDANCFILKAKMRAPIYNQDEVEKNGNGNGKWKKYFLGNKIYEYNACDRILLILDEEEEYRKPNIEELEYFQFVLGV